MAITVVVVDSSSMHFLEERLTGSVRGELAGDLNIVLIDGNVCDVGVAVVTAIGVDVESDRSWTLTAATFASALPGSLRSSSPWTRSIPASPRQKMARFKLGNGD
jgi:hypothetical protein